MCQSYLCRGLQIRAFGGAKQTPAIGLAVGGGLRVGYAIPIFQRNLQESVLWPRKAELLLRDLRDFEKAGSKQEGGGGV